MSHSRLVRKAVGIDKFISTLGLTPTERSQYVADRLAIEKHIPADSHVLEFGSRPSVSLFIEKRKEEGSRHIVLDDDAGDRARLKELIAMNKMDLDIVPLEDFVDIYSYNAIVVDNVTGDLSEILSDFPLDMVNVIVVSHGSSNADAKEALFGSFCDNGFDQAEVVVESAGSNADRDVAVFVRPAPEEEKKEGPAAEEEEKAEEPASEEKAEGEPAAEEKAEEADEKEEEEKAEEAAAEEEEKKEPAAEEKEETDEAAAEKKRAEEDEAAVTKAADRISVISPKRDVSADGETMTVVISRPQRQRCTIVIG